MTTIILCIVFNDDSLRCGSSSSITIYLWYKTFRVCSTPSLYRSVQKTSEVQLQYFVEIVRECYCYEYCC